jgi:hypothetical protein
VKLLKDDIKLLERLLSNYPSGLHRELLSDYLREYVQALGEETKGRTEASKQNSARFYANTWIRKKVMALQ